MLNVAAVTSGAVTSGAVTSGAVTSGAVTSGLCAESVWFGSAGLIGIDEISCSSPTLLDVPHRPTPECVARRERRSSNLYAVVNLVWLTLSSATVTATAELTIAPAPVTVHEKSCVISVSVGDAAVTSGAVTSGFAVDDVKPLAVTSGAVTSGGRSDQRARHRIVLLSRG